MNSPLVSIIIPCYNCERFISQCVNSCLNQTYNNIEIIVVDDGSTDNTYSILTNFKEKIVLLKQENKGAPKARNEGLKIADGEFIKFLDGDDELLSDAIEKQVCQSLKYKEADNTIIYGELRRINEDGSKRWRVKPRTINKNTNQIAFLVENNYIVTSCPLHRKSYLMKIGGFNESLKAGQEQELHLRLALSGIKFVYFPTIIYYYRSYYSINRMASNSWVLTDPKFGLLQLNHLKELIKESNIVFDNDIKKAFVRRHLHYAKSLIRKGKYKEAIDHYKGIRFIDIIGIIRNKSDILCVVYYIDYKIFDFSFVKTLKGNK